MYFYYIIVHLLGNNSFNKDLLNNYVVRLFIGSRDRAETKQVKMCGFM